jgi:hypothetical protein
MRQHPAAVRDHTGGIHMKLFRGAAIVAASISLAFAAPAFAADDPFVGGDFVEVTGVTLDDGHYLDYATFLAGFYRAQEEYAISQGWQTSWEVLANTHKRAGEPDLYLIRRYKNMVDGAEGDRRSAQIRDHVKMTDAQMEAASGDRAKFRHIQGTTLLQVMNIRK